VGGSDPDIVSGLNRTVPAFTGKNRERQAKLSQDSSLTLWELITDERFESDARSLLRKLNFLFGDSVSEDAEVMYDGSYKWLRRLGGRHFFLMNMERMFSLSFIQSMFLHRSMEWELTTEQSKVSLGWISHHTAIPVGHGKNVVGLLSGSLKAKYPIGETPRQADMFINQFMTVKGDLLKGKFRALGWVHSSDNYWWSRMVGFVLKDLKEELQTSLYVAVRAVQYGIPQSSHHFLAMLDRYNPKTCTFFTLVGEMGFALHEMYEVSGLAMRDIPYEEYVPSAEKLHLMEESVPLVYATYWKVLCHFHVCAETTGLRSGGVKQMAWADYLFNGLEDKAD